MGWLGGAAWRGPVAGSGAAVIALCCLLLPQGARAAAKRKPLFEYDDHYVMLNDFERNNFYRRALRRVMPQCGPDCSVLDVGAGSGLLSMMAANLGAKQVLAIEANPALATLAEATIGANREKNFPGSNVTVVAELSSRVDLERMPQQRPADVLVTETFGTMLLGEGAINFVPDARDRLLKKGGIVVPQGGCQYATLVEVPAWDAVMRPRDWNGMNMSRFESLQDTVYWKASWGAANFPLKRLSDRVCVLEIDLRTDTKESIPLNRTFRIQATKPGTVQAVLFDWDVWADETRQDIMTTAPGDRNFAGDVAWGWLLQLLEESGPDWQFGPRPTLLEVQQGDALDLGIEYIARGISLHGKVRRAPAGDPGGATLPYIPPPVRMRGVNRGDIVEANEFYLAIAGDAERHGFYDAALRAGLLKNGTQRQRPTVLDCSSGAGMPSLLAAKQHGLRTLTLASRSEWSKVLRKVAQDNGVEELMESYAADARELMEALLPNSERVDVVVVDPPGTPVHGLSPFAVLPSVRKHLLREGGVVVPAGGCLEVGLVESIDLAYMFSVPGRHWEEIDLAVWNEEARRQRVLERLVPYTKWIGNHSSVAFKWLSEPRCVFDADFQNYGIPGQDPPAPETTSTQGMAMTADGSAHAVVARWVVWATNEDRTTRLGAESGYLGRALTWPHYVQAIAAPDTLPGVMDPVVVRAGEVWNLEVGVKQGSAKVTGAAGPEFSLRMLGKVEPGEGRQEI